MAQKQITFDGKLLGPWICDRISGKYDGSPCIGLMQGSYIIAGVMYDHWNGRSICMHVAAEHGARWMIRRYLWMCFDYPFVQLGVNKILGLVDSTNTAARRFDEHLGFQLEATINDAGREGDLLIYSMIRQQCRFLELEAHYGKQIEHSSAT